MAIEQILQPRGGARLSPSARTLIPLAAALAVALLASCSDNVTGPLLGVTVSVSSLAGPSYYADSTGRQFVRCDLTLQARNAGTRRAGWLDATFAFYVPSDSTTPASVDTIPATTISSSWGADSIGADSTQTAHWRLSASVPFALKLQFHFRTSGGLLDSSGVSVSCESPTSPGPPPTITSLQYQGDTPREPGDTLLLYYAAASPLGLWQSVIHVTGPCDTTLLFPEHPLFGVSRYVSLVMPARCSLGVPIGVTATAFDVRLQQTSQSLTLPALVDHTPPIMSARLRTVYGDWAPAASSTGYLFPGDALEILATVTDNHLLHGVYWEVGRTSFQDSLLLSGAAATPSIAFPAQTAWVGPIELRLYAKDGSGNVTDTITSSPGAIEVFPNVGPAPTLTTVPDGVTDLTFDAKRGLIYVLQADAYKIVVLSQASLTVLRTIALTDLAPTIDLSPSGDSLITVLMNSHALGIVDLTQASSALQVVPLEGLNSTYRLLSIRVAANGQALIATQHLIGGGAKRLYSYDLASGTQRLRLDAPDLGYESSCQLERSTDGSVVMVNGGAGAFLRYDAGTDTFAPGQTARIQDTRPSIDATGAHIAVSGDLYDASLQYVRTVRAALRDGGAAALSPDGQTHYQVIAPAYSPRGFVRSRVSDGSISDRVPVPLPLRFLRVSPDGSTLAVVGVDAGVTKIGLVNLGQLH